MESFHGYRSVILGMRNSRQGKQRTWSGIGALFPLCYQAINPNFILTLIAMKTNYEQQDLELLMKVGVNKARWRNHWGNIGRMRALRESGFTSPGIKQNRTGEPALRVSGDP